MLLCFKLKGEIVYINNIQYAIEQIYLLTFQPHVFYKTNPCTIQTIFRVVQPPQRKHLGWKSMEKTFKFAKSSVFFGGIVQLQWFNFKAKVA